VDEFHLTKAEMRKLVLCLAALGLISLSLGQTCPPASAEELRVSAAHVNPSL